MATMVELTMQGLNGDTLATLRCTTVYEVKQRLSNCCSTMVGQQQLTLGCHILDDRKTLSHCGVEAPATTLQCVRLCPSGIASYLEALKDKADPDEAIAGSMADIADSVMQFEHEKSERHRPCASDVARAMTHKRRAELVSWMVQAFETLQFTDEILHNTVLTLDRYYARCSEIIPDCALQKILLAAVCTEMKLASTCEFPPGHWQRIIAHLCQGRLDVPCILRTEREMLSKLDYAVGVPTALTFLNGLSMRVQEDTPTVEANQWMSSALFFLELALGDVQVMHAYPHAVLAAAALHAALRACGAPEEKHEQVLEDLSAYCPACTYTEDSVAACEEELLTLWLRSSKNENELGEFYTRLDLKFRHRAGHAISKLSPEAVLRQQRQATSPRSSEPGTPDSSKGRSIRECADDFKLANAFTTCVYAV